MVQRIKENTANLEKEFLEELVDTNKQAQILGIPSSMLSKYRSTGEVRIPYFKIGRHVRYSPKKTREALEAHFLKK